MITPTIGRRVWYWPEKHESTHERVLDPRQPCDAGVVFVHDDRCVNLLVTDHAGDTHRRWNVRLLQAGEERPGGGFAEWMPYQVKAASKE